MQARDTEEAHVNNFELAPTAPPGYGCKPHLRSVSEKSLLHLLTCTCVSSPSLVGWWTAPSPLPGTHARSRKTRKHPRQHNKKIKKRSHATHGRDAIKVHTRAPIARRLCNANAILVRGNDFITPSRQLIEMPVRSQSICSDEPQKRSYTFPYFCSDF